MLDFRGTAVAARSPSILACHEAVVSRRFLIAAAPLLLPRLWEKYHAQAAVGLGLWTVCFYLFGLHRAAPLGHAASEYLSFLSLVGALYVVSGGILLKVKGEATPLENCLFLFLGALLANLLGTTGASMLLIRPWIRMNKYRITDFHIVFFIFIVSNVGGCLTPIGDPPLFLGFLKGVPFWWSLQHCWKPWLLTLGAGPQKLPPRPGPGARTTDPGRGLAGGRPLEPAAYYLRSRRNPAALWLEGSPHAFGRGRLLALDPETHPRGQRF